MKLSEYNGRFVAHYFNVNQIEQHYELKYPKVRLSTKQMMQCQIVEVESDQQLLGVLLCIEFRFNANGHHRHRDQT
jgi:hypothetical protein